MAGDVDGLRRELSARANVDALDESSNTALILAALAGATSCVELLLAAKANPTLRNEYDENAIAVASNVDIIRLLQAAGEDIADISTEMKRTLTGLPRNGAQLNVTKQKYLADKKPRFGAANPQVMDLPFWREMVRSGISAYEAQTKLEEPDGVVDGPVWCFDRFGMSFTELPDGRFVEIAGEHEDSYDPDFCIYNDVVVHDGPGEFRILGYPKEVFPPTDFHSATLVDGSIYIIGRLGYFGTRKFGTTPIYRLDCDSWRIEEVEATGQNPGWIYKHRARLDEGRQIVVSGGKICRPVADKEEHIDNMDEFCLSLDSMKWARH